MKELLANLALMVEQTTEQIKKEQEKAIQSGLIDDLLIFFIEFKEGYKALDDLRKQIYHLLDALDKGSVPDAIEGLGLDLVRVPAIGRSFYIAPKLSASIVSDRKDEAYDWLRKNGASELITETVNASTLSAFVKDMISEKNMEPPPELFKVNTYRTTGSAKYNPKGK